MKMLAKYVCLPVDSDLIAESLPESRILLDIREPSLYEKSHLKESVNLLTSSLLLRRLQRGSLTITNLLPENVVKRLRTDDYCDSLILYDENSSTDNESRNITVIASALKKVFPKKTICYINKGFAKFCEEFPHLCDFDYPVDGPNPLQISIHGEGMMGDPTDKNIFSPATDLCPVSILPHLYLGNAHHASQKDLLDKFGITAILNVSRCPVAFKNSYEYKNIAVDDTNQENISTHFIDAINFIENIKSKGGIVLVHCRAGISRSATICIAYLMRNYEFSLDAAYEYTKKRRAAISPNFNFLGQLLAFESELNAQRKSDLLKRPATAGYKTGFSLKLDIKKAPLTSSQFNNSAEFFTYSPKNCMNFFNTSTDVVTSPYRALLTPS